VALIRGRERPTIGNENKRKIYLGSFQEINRENLKLGEYENLANYQILWPENIPMNIGYVFVKKLGIKIIKQ
jgi:hypothetical protein